MVIALSIDTWLKLDNCLLPLMCLFDFQLIVLLMGTLLSSGMVIGEEVRSTSEVQALCQQVCGEWGPWYWECKRSEC